MDQTADDLQIHTIDTHGDVSARTENGSIVDARTGVPGTDDTKIFGNPIDLWADGGSIGDPSGNNDLELFSHRYAPGTIGLRAAAGIYAAQTSGNEQVVWIQAFGNHGHQPYTVRFTVRHSSATSGEDLNLLASGSVLFAETGPEAVLNGFINTPNGSIELRVGDNVHTDPNAQIVGGNNIDLYGDYARVNEASSGGFVTDSSDPGYGSIMHLAGVITPGTLSGSCASEINPGLDCNITRIFGNEDGDTFTFDQTYLGGRTFVYGSNTPTCTAHTAVACAGMYAPLGDGEDFFFVNQLPTMNVAAGHTLTLDGQSGTNTYVINTTGSQPCLHAAPRQGGHPSGATSHNYVINLLDTHAPSDGTNVLIVNGYH